MLLDNNSNHAYSYDAYGRLSGINVGANAFAYTRLTNSGLIETLTRPNSVNTAWSFEANRNLVSSVENKLGQTTVSKYDYTNDYLGRRIMRTEYSKNGAELALVSTEKYVYDKWNCIAQYDADNTLVKSWMWGEDLSGSMDGAGGVGGLLAETNADGTYFPTYDGNGNIRSYQDSTGTAVAAYEYDPFGRIISSTGSKSADFTYTFSTKPLDRTTGLVYYIYRDYDPILGRWLSKEPMGEEGSSNLFSFIFNSTIDLYDVLGLFGDGQRSSGNKKAPLGHSDFNGGDRFNYIQYDHDPKTSPIPNWKGEGNPEGHFQPLEQSHAEVDAAIRSCDKGAFEGAMHRMQDYWSHKKKGYNWDPKTLAGRAGAGLLAGGVSGMVGAVLVGEYVSPTVGHGGTSLVNITTGLAKDPDADGEAWKDANDVSRYKVGLWDQNCCECNGKWYTRASGKCGDN